jgi:hypothetical protein
MDMPVERNLVPGLGHLQKVIKPELRSDHPWLSRGSGAEIVSQLQLAAGRLGPNQFLHDLEQDTACVVPEFTAGAMQHLVPDGSEGHESLIGSADLQNIEQVDDRMRNPQLLGSGHFLDAIGMEVRNEQTLEGLA